MKSQDVANALWALAVLGWQVRDGVLHRGELEGALLRVAKIMNAQEVADTMWALATLCWQGSNEMRELLEAAMVRVAPSLTARDVVSTVYSLAALGWCIGNDVANIFEASVKGLFEDGRLSDVPHVVLSQLLHAHLASQLLGLRLITLPSSHLQLVLDVHRHEVRTAPKSNGQRAVGESLCRLGIPHELKYIAPDVPLGIDLAFVERRVALEFDSPSHFAANTLEPLGHTRLRDRLLSAMGWHVLSIPFFEWAALQQTSERDGYVERRVNRAFVCTDRQ